MAGGMKMKIRSHRTSNLAQIRELENNHQAKGYVLVDKKDENELNPLEYIKLPQPASEESFEDDTITYILYWLEQEQ
jgi:hypothetical protein